MAQVVNQPAFKPAGVAVTVNASFTTSSSTLQLPLGAKQGARHLRIYNSGTVTVFIEFGGSGMTAAVASAMPIPAGEVEIVSLVPFENPSNLDGPLFVAGITSSGSATLYFTPGEGT
jgi:acetyl-CoA acetyltransferase